MNALNPIAIESPRTAAYRALRRIDDVGRMRAGLLVLLLVVIGPVLGFAIFLGADTLNHEKVVASSPVRNALQRPHALGFASFLGWEVLLVFGVFLFKKRRKEDAYRQFRLAREIVRNISDGVVVADVKGRLILSNEAARRVTGRGPRDAPWSQWSHRYGFFLPENH